MKTTHKVLIVLGILVFIIYGYWGTIKFDRVHKEQDTINKQWVKVFLEHGLGIKLPPGTVVQNYRFDFDGPDASVDAQLLIHEKLIALFEASLPFDSKPSQSKYNFTFGTEQHFWHGCHVPKNFRFYEQGPIKPEGLRLLIDFDDPKQPIVYIEWFETS